MSDTEKTGRAGRDEKGDVLVELTPNASGREIQLQSSVKALFGRHLHQLIEQTLTELNVNNVTVKVTDRGALDFVLIARLECAMQQFCGKTRPIKPAAHATPQRRRMRRTRLYLPGNNPDLMINAGLYGADAVILDLEDSVAPQEKESARFLVAHALAQVDFGDSEIMVRINSLRTPFGQADVEKIVPLAPQTLLIPKCESRDDVVQTHELVAKLEKQAGPAQAIQFMPLIESAQGALHAEEIALASERNVALCFGAEDFTADIGAERTLEGRECFTARTLILLAAKAAGIQAIDTVYANVQDEEGLIASTCEAIGLGFEGKGVIHPAQIKPIHQAFCPTAEQIVKAKQIVAALEEAKAKGSGVISLGSKMIDAPVVLRAERTLAMAKEYGIA
jgi:citrate lyase subunit beta / citryl-CoA lyase